MQSAESKELEMLKAELDREVRWLHLQSVQLGAACRRRPPT